MKKKVLATLLAAAMTAGALAGCGGNSAETPAQDTPAAEAPAEDTSAADEAPAAEEAPAEDTSAEAAPAANDAIANLIAATTGPVALTVWASEEDQDLTNTLLDGFKAQYPDVTFEITLGAESESTAKDTILTDVEAAADVFAFADDQINDLVQAGALQEVVANYTYDVAASNVSGAVEAAGVDGKLYAYPMTADNGYFMFYDSSVFSESDVTSLEKMIEVADAAGKKIAMDISNGWYIYAFFQGAGLELTLNDDGSNTCTWNAAGGTDVAQAIIDLTASNVFVDMGDEDMATQIAEGNVVACVNGTWRAETAQTAWGDNYAATKLPTFNAGGKDYQMSSYSGYKLIGVNPHSANLGWAMLLAEFLTNEDSQKARFDARGLGPANSAAAASDAVQANPAIAALAEQAAYATPQRVGGNFWSPAETLGQILASGNPDGTDLQELLDTTVEGITAPIE
ncbi:MAG: extracellular solute-binding protein [Bacteroidales bacterium]|nr:extracellular solute-binding protein [Bacteroidales bacterium]MCM1416337.1 extracellular solute-binding protein [bacterium]MCM1423250.1 extracellular solute-binding protein [bacterium]